MIHEATRSEVAGRVLLAALGLFVAGAGIGGAALHHVQGAREAQEPANAATSPRPAPRRTAEEVVAEFDANPSPGFALDMEPEEFDRLLRERLTRQCELALELWREHLGHPKTGELLFSRWMNLVNYFGTPAPVRAETSELLRQHPPESLASVARFVRGQASIWDESLARDEVAADVEAAVASAKEPKLVRGFRSFLLVELARRRTADPAAQRALLERAVAASKSDEEKHEAEAELALLRRVGEPLELAFDDAFTGRRTELAALRGRPVLLHLFSPASTTAEKDRAQLAALREELSALGAIVVTIEPWTGREDLEEVRAAARRLGVESPFFADVADDVDGLERTWAWRLGLRGAPRLLWLDREGRLAAIATRAAALRGELARLAH